MFLKQAISPYIHHMKKKYTVLMHVAFWAIFILSNSFSKYSSNSFYSYRSATPGIGLYVKYLLIEFGYAFILFSCFYGSFFL